MRPGRWFSTKPSVPGSGQITIKRSDDGSTVETISVPGSQVSRVRDDGHDRPRRVTLADNTSYYVEVTSGAIEDLAGNAFAGISGRVGLELDDRGPAADGAGVVAVRRGGGRGPREPTC